MKIADFIRINDSARTIPAGTIIDVAQVVRCKECKYSYYDLSGLCCTYGVCLDSIVPEDFYCANGDRRCGCEEVTTTDEMPL